jgi:tripartite ATP-independent transporter DctP family solute receptor
LQPLFSPFQTPFKPHENPYWYLQLLPVRLHDNKLTKSFLLHPSLRSFFVKLSKLFLYTGVSFGLMVAASAPAQAQAQITMRNAISVAENSHAGEAVVTLAREVEKRTNGRIVIKNFFSGSLGGEREVMEAVQLGTQELGHNSTGPVPNFVPETAILDVPFLFRDKAHARAVLDGPIGQELLAKFESKGFKALAWTENGVRHMTNNKRPVNSPDDLKGLKMRTMENPVHVAAYKGLGIVTTPMAFPEVFTALQTGTIDGQENPLSVILAANFDQVQKHITLTGHVYSPSVFVMNKAVFDKLSKADQQIFLDAAKEGAKANRARVDKDDAGGVAELRKRGMTVVENVDKTKFIATMAPVNAEFEKKFGKANLDRIRNFK